MFVVPSGGGNIPGGVSFYNGSSFSNVTVGSNTNIINHLQIDDFNSKWISSNEGLFVISANNPMTIYNTTNSLISSNNITCTKRDLKGNLWITTSGGGLNQFKVK